MPKYGGMHHLHSPPPPNPPLSSLDSCPNMVYYWKCSSCVIFWLSSTVMTKNFKNVLYGSEGHIMVLFMLVSIECSSHFCKGNMLSFRETKKIVSMPKLQWQPQKWCNQLCHFGFTLRVPNFYTCNKLCLVHQRLKKKSCTFWQRLLKLSLPVKWWENHLKAWRLF